MDRVAGVIVPSHVGCRALVRIWVHRAWGVVGLDAPSDRGCGDWGVAWESRDQERKQWALLSLRSEVVAGFGDGWPSCHGVCPEPLYRDGRIVSATGDHRGHRVGLVSTGGRSWTREGPEATGMSDRQLPGDRKVPDRDNPHRSSASEGSHVRLSQKTMIRLKH